MNTETDDALSRDSEVADALAPGTMFGPYEVVGVLGKGGMGTVYEATHTLLKKRVAIKTLHTSAVGNGQARQRFIREGQAASKLDHPHVVSVSDVGIQNGIPYLVMELMSGEDLSTLLQRTRGLSVERAVEIMVPVCTAVQAAHRVGIIHRDLKPENIFLATNGLGQTVPKVLDFGISKLADSPSEHALTGSGALIGTSYYMSPEQAMAAKTIDARSDQYALGVILYECVTGRRAIVGESLYAILFAITERRFERPRALKPDLPERFEAMILRAMSLHPADRFASCEDLARDLLAFGDTETQRTWARHLGKPAEASPSGVGAGQISPNSALPAADPTRPDTLSDTAREISRRSIQKSPVGRSRRRVASAVFAALALGAVALAIRPHGPTASAAPRMPAVAPLAAAAVTATPHASGGSEALATAARPQPPETVAPTPRPVSVVAAPVAPSGRRGRPGRTRGSPTVVAAPLETRTPSSGPTAVQPAAPPAPRTRLPTEDM